MVKILEYVNREQNTLAGFCSPFVDDKYVISVYDDDVSYGSYTALFMPHLFCCINKELILMIFVVMLQKITSF